MTHASPTRFGPAIRSAALILLIGVSNAWGGDRVDIPKPTGRLQPAPSPPALEQSVVRLEITLPVEELALLVNETLPQVSAKEDGWTDPMSVPERDDLRFLYRLVRGPFTYRMSQNRLELKFDEIRYRVWARQTRPDAVVDSRCGHGDDPPKRVQVAAHSALSWSEDWRIRSATTFDPPAFLEACQLRELNLDGATLLQPLIQTRLKKLAETIDRKLEERNASKQRAETVWKKLQEPFELNRNRWLAFNPRDAQASPITSSGGLAVSTAVNLAMHPQIVGVKPAATDVPLPPLKLAPTGQDDFRLVLPVFADYGKINTRLEQKLVGQRFDTPVGEDLVIAGAELYGSGEKLIVALRVTGGVNGTLYAAGIPVFDEPTRSLKFTDLDFTVDTRNVLVRSASRLAYDALIEKMKSEVSVDLSEPLTLMQSRLNAALSRELAPGARLEGSMTKLRPGGIYPVEGGVEAHVVAQGSIRLIFR